MKNAPSGNKWLRARIVNSSSPAVFTRSSCIALSWLFHAARCSGELPSPSRALADPSPASNTVSRSMSPRAAAVQMSAGLVSCASREAAAAMKKTQQPAIKLIDSLTRQRRLPKLLKQGERGNSRQKKSPKTG